MTFIIVSRALVKAYQDTQGKMSHAVYMKPRAEFSILILLSRSFRNDEIGESLLKQSAVFPNQRRLLERLYPVKET
jgi:hypothetical protein